MIAQSSKECQIKDQKTFNKLHPLLKKPNKYFNQHLNDSDRLIIGALIKIERKTNYEFFLASNIAIAKAAGSNGHQGVGLGSVKRTIDRLVDDGLLIKINRGIKKVCAYRLSNYFKKEWVKRRLVNFFVSVLILPVALLFSVNLKSMQSEYRQEIKEIKKYLFRNNIHHIQKRNAVSKKGIKIGSWCESMEAKDNIFSEIEKIKRIELTKRGIVELTKYDPRAIMYANEQFKHAYNLKKPFRWFCKICNDVTKANNWPFHFQLYNKLIILSNFSGDEVMYDAVKEKQTAVRKASTGIYAPYVHQERDEKPIEEELRIFTEYEKTEEAQKAKKLGLFFVPPRIKEYLATHLQEQKIYTSDSK